MRWCFPVPICDFTSRRTNRGVNTALLSSQRRQHAKNRLNPGSVDAIGNKPRLYGTSVASESDATVFNGKPCLPGAIALLSKGYVVYGLLFRSNLTPSAKGKRSIEHVNIVVVVPGLKELLSKERNPLMDGGAACHSFGTELFQRRDIYGSRKVQDHSKN